MTVSEIGGSSENFRVRVTSKREKAVAASQLGRVISDMGESHDVASDFAGHEIRHALAHRGSGYIGVRSNDFLMEAYYEPENPEQLSEEERRLIAEAVGREEMSHQDMKAAKKKPGFGK